LSRAFASLREVLGPRDQVFADLLLEQAELVEQAMDLLFRYLQEPSEDLAKAIADCEERGDAILAELQQALREALVTPLGGSDINYLGNALDDLLDQFEDMVMEDLALEAAGIGESTYDEPHYTEVLVALHAALKVVPTAMRSLLGAPAQAAGRITELRRRYQEGKQAYSLAYAAIMAGRDDERGARSKNRLRWLRQHLRRIEKLANAMAGILANS
jgi:hypothetical protein